MKNNIESKNNKNKLNRKLNKLIQAGTLALGLSFFIGDGNYSNIDKENNKIELNKTKKTIEDDKNIEIIEINISNVPFYDYKNQEGLANIDLSKKGYNRNNIKFEDGESVYFNRQPGILEKGRKYNSEGYIYKYNRGKKYVVRGITSKHIFKEIEISVGQYSELVNIIPEIKYIVRRDLYLKENATLSKSDFDLFFNKKKLTETSGQKNTGNCFLIASFRALMESPNYETLIRTSVTYDKNLKKFEIKLPLGNPNGQVFTVFESDLVPQKNYFYNPQQAVYPQTVPCQKVKRDNTKKIYVKQVNPKTKEPITGECPAYFKPMEGPKGLQALEVAFLRYYTGDVFISFDRHKMANGGYGDEALKILLGENESNELRIKMDGKNDKKGFFKFLDNYNPYTTYATLNSNCKSGKTDQNFFTIEGLDQKIYYKHAYALIGTNPILRTVTIINPWHLNEPIELTYEQAFEGFYRVRGAKPDFEKGFKNSPFC